MKNILLSIKPKYVAKILNREKTIEIRKTMPKCDLPITVYIYCTKENATTKPLLLANKDIVSDNLLNQHNVRWLNGKVVAKFTLRKVEEFTNDELWEKCFKTEELITKSCVPFSRLMAYSRASSIYAYHIEDLVIFDKPRELSEFKHYQDERIKVMGNPYPISFFGSVAYHYEKKSVLKPLTKAPQNFCYVESEE